MRLRYNGLRATLNGSLTNSATSVTFAAALTHSGGTAVPTLAGGDYIPLSILDSDGVLSEVVWLTAYTTAGTTGTIARGKEGTTGVSHADGSAVRHSPTVADAGPAMEWNSDQVSLDEFDDGALDSAWGRVDKSGGTSRVSWAERESGLFVKTAGGDSTAELHAMVRSISSMSTGDGFMTAVRIFAPSSNLSAAGIVIADGNASGSGGQVHGIAYMSGTGPFRIGTQSLTNYQTQDAGGVVDDQNFAQSGRVLIRTCLVAANTWRTDWSLEGSLWRIGGTTKSKTITPAYAGVVASSWGSSNQAVIQYDYFRRVSGVS